MTFLDRGTLSLDTKLSLDLKSLGEAIGGGAAGGIAILGLLRWAFQGHFFDWVESAFDARGAAIKEKIVELFEGDISRREAWIEEVRRNQQSITGLTAAMAIHDKELAALRNMPVLMEQQLQLMTEVREELAENRKTIGLHAQDLARLIERRNTIREG